jgi:hypothetical protein
MFLLFRTYDIVSDITKWLPGQHPGINYWSNRFDLTRSVCLKLALAGCNPALHLPSIGIHQMNVVPPLLAGFRKASLHTIQVPVRY